MKKIRVAILLAGLLMGSNQASAQETKIRGFADAAFSADEKENSSYSTGQFVSFITSQLSDRVSFLGESVFEYDGGWIVDVERVVLNYDVNTHISFQAGKFHTPLGYWNNAYHHGALLQPTIQRPLAVRFEDEGGVLPIHSTGVWLKGRGFTSFNLGFDINLGNGISASPVEDQNRNKAITLAVFAEPVEGFRVGLSSYMDQISSGTPILDGTETPLAAGVKQRIVNINATYEVNQFQAIGEWYEIRNASTGVTIASSRAYFLYAGYTFGKTTPFLKYDALDYGSGDVYFGSNNRTMITAGCRYDLESLSNVKMEFQRTNTSLDGSLFKVIFAWAIGF